MRTLLAVAVLAMAALLSACSHAPDQKQALYSAESAYTLIANDEAAAIKTGLVAGGAITTMKKTDDTVYTALVAWRGAVEAGRPAPSAAIAGVAAGTQSLLAQLGAAHAISPNTRQVASTALALLAAFIGG